VISVTRATSTVITNNPNCELDLQIVIVIIVVVTVVTVVIVTVIRRAAVQTATSAGTAIIGWHPAFHCRIVVGRGIPSGRGLDVHFPPPVTILVVTLMVMTTVTRGRR
jgi:hypothetical protein